MGGTIVPTGGYVAGDAELVEMACSRLTSPGIGSSSGINFGLGRLILQGLFLSTTNCSRISKRCWYGCSSL